MAQVTIREVEEEWLARAKAQADKRGVPMNTFLKETLERGLGMLEKEPTNGLERFAGTCRVISTGVGKAWRV